MPPSPRPPQAVRFWVGEQPSLINTPPGPPTPGDSDTYSGLRIPAMLPAFQ